MIVATTGNVVVLVAVNAAIFPVPDAARPIDMVLLTHVYDVALPYGSYWYKTHEESS